MRIRLILIAFCPLFLVPAFDDCSAFSPSALQNSTSPGSIDHYRILHDGSALTCAPENIQVKACLDANCAVEFAGNVQASLSPSEWVGGNSQTFLSGDTLQLRHTTVEAATLGIKGNRAEFIAENPPRCFIGSAEQPDCTLLFNDTGFIFDVPDHVAGTIQTVTLAAVRRDVTTQQCVPGFQSVTRDISLWSDYLNPGSRTLPVVINNNPIVFSPPGSYYSLDFDNNGEVTIDIAYADVGQINLNAFYQGSGDDAGLFMAGVDSFITRPDHFIVTVPGNPGATSAAGNVFTKAGETFLIQVSARNASGNVTPNYGQEAVPESVRLTQNLMEPAGQHNPPLVGNFGLFGTNCKGDYVLGYVCGEFRWDEVGIINVLPFVADGSYLGTGNVSGFLSGSIGRFIPDRFSVSENMPQLDHGCAVGGYTYLKQEFGFLIDPVLTFTALGSTGSTLLNYGNDFWKYMALLSNRGYSHSGPEPMTVHFSTKGATTLSGDTDYDGIGMVEVSSDRLTYDKPAAAVSPFSTMVDLNVLSSDLQDSDGVCYDPENDETCNSFTLSTILGGEQRYGRMQLQNTYGPETLPLTVPILTEYYDGTSYILNNLDSCTVYNSSILRPVSPMAVGAGETISSGSGTLSDGLGYNLTLSTPGVGNDGSIILEYDLDAAGLEWLKFNGNNPTAKATFGIFKGNERLIYMRESIW